MEKEMKDYIRGIKLALMLQDVDVLVVESKATANGYTVLLNLTDARDGSVARIKHEYENIKAV